ncbi:MAG: hypothetical protein PHT88_03465 [Candidatus Moranbacteria bacterium]|nr:hypothetical protein [Candidatus Moranbacteria bacterium]
METFLVVAEAMTILAAMMSIVYTVGIVWRVEKELDVSYKFFAFAIVFFLIAELLNVYYVGHGVSFAVAEKLSKVVFSALFLVGTLYMRDIIRKLDGEKRKQKGRK